MNIQFELWTAGFTLIPLKGKRPYTLRWQNTPYPQHFIEIKGNYGVLCNGLLILDIDARNGGVESLKKLTKRIPDIQRSGFVVATGSGGGSQHIYFKLSPLQQKKLKAKLSSYPGIDFKTSGQVVGPGSVHPDTHKTYEIAHGNPGNIINAPSALIKLLTPTQSLPQTKKQQNTSVKTIDFNHQSDWEKIESILDELDPDMDHDEWVKVGMAIKSTVGETGFELWNSWSRRGGKYKAKEMGNIWRSFKRDGVKMGTLIHMAGDRWKERYKQQLLVSKQQNLSSPSPSPPLIPLCYHSPMDAQKKINEEVHDFMNNGVSKILKWTAGGGKTSAVVDNLLPGTEIYVPTHEKAEELKADIEAKYPTFRVHVPQGRSRKRNGECLCKKHVAAEKLASLGERIYSKLCNDNVRLCEHFQTCEWVKQWDRACDVRVLPHTYLDLERGKLETLNFKTERMVIDESFHPTLLRRKSFKLNDFIDSEIEENIKNLIVNSLRAGHPLLKSLRDAGITIKDVQEEIDRLNNNPTSTPSVLNDINPHTPLDMLDALLDGIELVDNFKFILRSILNEYAFDRDICHSISYYKTPDDGIEKLAVHYKKQIPRLTNDRYKMLSIVDKLAEAPLPANVLIKKLNIDLKEFYKFWDELENRGIILFSSPHQVGQSAPLKLVPGFSAGLEDLKKSTQYPLLIIDADANQQIINTLLEMDLKIIEINCKDVLHVTQLNSASVCATSLHMNPEFYLNLAVRQIQTWQMQGKTVVVIGPQNICGNPSTDIQPHPLLKGSGCSLAHFGAIRGLNSFKDVDCAVVIGRNQPPVHEIESQARGLFANDDKPLELLNSDDPLPKKMVAYRMHDGTNESANVEMHPDDRVQAILEQYREKETEQAIRRLRTVWHEGDPKECFIMSNIPLPSIVVDKLISTRELNSTSNKAKKLISLLNDIRNSLPLSEEQFDIIELLKKLGIGVKKTGGQLFVKELQNLSSATEGDKQLITQAKRVGLKFVSKRVRNKDNNVSSTNWVIDSLWISVINAGANSSVLMAQYLKVKELKDMAEKERRQQEIFEKEQENIQKEQARLARIEQKRIEQREYDAKRRNKEQGSKHDKVKKFFLEVKNGTEREWLEIGVHNPAVFNNLFKEFEDYILKKNQDIYLKRAYEVYERCKKQHPIPPHFDESISLDDRLAYYYIYVKKGTWETWETLLNNESEFNRLKGDLNKAYFDYERQKNSCERC